MDWLHIIRLIVAIYLCLNVATGLLMLGMLLLYCRKQQPQH
jgi:hypothetical protein